MTRNLRRGRGRCLCGLRTTLHFTTDNRKLACAEARRLHARATVRPTMFYALLKGACK